MRASILLAAALAGLLLAGSAAAQNASQNTTIVNDPDDEDEPTNVQVPTPIVNVREEPSESTGPAVGLDGTMLGILLIVGLLVIALVVGLAGRDRWW